MQCDAKLHQYIAMQFDILQSCHVSAKFATLSRECAVKDSIYSYYKMEHNSKKIKISEI